VHHLLAAYEWQVSPSLSVQPTGRSSQPSMAPCWVGLGVGAGVGSGVTRLVGEGVGLGVGFGVGLSVGGGVGGRVGLAVGFAVGLEVGFGVCLVPPPQLQHALIPSTPFEAYIWNVSRMSHMVPAVPSSLHHFFSLYTSQPSPSLSTQLVKSLQASYSGSYGVVVVVASGSSVVVVTAATVVVVTGATVDTTSLSSSHKSISLLDVLDPARHFISLLLQPQPGDEKQSIAHLCARQSRCAPLSQLPRRSSALLVVTPAMHLFRELLHPHPTALAQSSPQTFCPHRSLLYPGIEAS